MSKKIYASLGLIALVVISFYLGRVTKNLTISVLVPKLDIVDYFKNGGDLNKIITSPGRGDILKVGNQYQIKWRPFTLPKNKQFQSTLRNLETGMGTTGMGEGVKLESGMTDLFISPDLWDTLEPKPSKGRPAYRSQLEIAIGHSVPDGGSVDFISDFVIKSEPFFMSK